MTSQEKQELIARYQDGYNQVAESLTGFPKDALTAHPIPTRLPSLILRYSRL